MGTTLTFSLEPSVAVVSTVLNEREGIAALLDGFLGQTRAPDEIVVVDGGSNDGTLEVLRDYEARHASVRVLVAPGVNIARGRNIAIDHAKANIIAVTDGGCRPEPDWLAELVKPLLDDESYGAVTGVRRIVSANRFEHFAGIFSTSGNAADEKARVFHGRNSAFRKSVWQSVGGYPDWLYTAEDTLFAMRAKALRCRVALAERAVVSWRPRPTLRKLAKQYFLYGRGTGRIGMADTRAAIYHLRNHAVWMLSLLLSVVTPWLLIPAVFALFHVWRTLLLPAMRSLQPAQRGFAAVCYVAMIVSVRSVANNAGQLYGHWEYRHADGFRDNLERYQAGTWRTQAASAMAHAP